MTDRSRLGRVQIYTGDGKGKTTAALGLAVRAAGHGLRTWFGQFMKGQPSGEHAALQGNPFITFEQFGDVRCIRREEVTAEHRQAAAHGLARAREALLSGRYDIIVLDEAVVAVWFGVLSEEDLLAFLALRPPQVEVILTGRRASAALIERADLVTEMVEVKHYYVQGIPARAGIEY